MEVDTQQPSEHGERRTDERTEQQNIEQLSKQLNALQQQLRTATLHTRRTARRISSMTRADMPRRWIAEPYATGEIGGAERTTSVGGTLRSDLSIAARRRRARYARQDRDD